MSVHAAAGENLLPLIDSAVRVTQWSFLSLLPAAVNKRYRLIYGHN